MLTPEDEIFKAKGFSHTISINLNDCLKHNPGPKCAFSPRAQVGPWKLSAYSTSPYILKTQGTIHFKASRNNTRETSKKNCDSPLSQLKSCLSNVLHYEGVSHFSLKVTFHNNFVPPPALLLLKMIHDIQSFTEGYGNSNSHQRNKSHGDGMFSFLPKYSVCPPQLGSFSHFVPHNWALATSEVWP